MGQLVHMQLVDGKGAGVKRGKFLIANNFRSLSVAITQQKKLNIVLRFGRLQKKKKYARYGGRVARKTHGAKSNGQFKCCEKGGTSMLLRQGTLPGKSTVICDYQPTKKKESECFEKVNIKRRRR